MKVHNKCPILLQAIDYESTLDTLVEWFGGVVPKETYKKRREGVDEVLELIETNKSVNKGDEKRRL